MNEKDKKKEGNGCSIVVIIAIFFTWWGVNGMADGHSFTEGIARNLKALGIIIIVGLAIMGYSKINE